MHTVVWILNNTVNDVIPPPHHTEKVCEKFSSGTKKHKFKPRLQLQNNGRIASCPTGIYS